MFQTRIDTDHHTAICFWAAGQNLNDDFSYKMQFIDALDGEDLLLTGEVKWRPLVEDNTQSILKVVSPMYNDAGL
uniref:Uncharacterized protein n=1 Tax=Fundulus heteroclitus TaxID=8078 RepID=A0A3Q2PBJ4_FUNHE